MFSQMAKFCSLFYIWVVFHCVYCIFLSIHVLIDSRLLPYFGIVNNVVLNIGVHVSFELVLLFLSYILRVEFLSHTVILFLIFWETFMMFFTLAAPIYIPTAVYKSSFFPHPQQHLLFVLFMMIAILRAKRQYLTVFLTCVCFSDV